MVDKNDPLFREVDEELRREQWTKLWEQYGTYAFVAAALIVVLVGGFKYWEWRQATLAETTGSKYEAALDLLENGKTDAGAKELQDIVANSPAGYSMMAELAVAGSQLKAGRRLDALATFEKVAGRRDVDPLIADFAKIQAAALRIGDADFAEIKGRLEPLAADTSPWRYSARELIGMAALKAGKLDEARQAFTPLLADPNVSPSMAERVRNLMSGIASSELAQQKGATPAPAQATTPAAPPAQK